MCSLPPQRSATGVMLLLQSQSSALLCSGAKLVNSMHLTPQKEWLGPAREGRPLMLSGSFRFGNSRWSLAPAVPPIYWAISRDEELLFDAAAGLLGVSEVIYCRQSA
jgi:hypothetical protein